MFFAVLRRQSTAIYRSQSPSPIVINLPTTLVANLEVKDQKGLVSFLSAFLKSVNFPQGEGVLLLSEEVNFCNSFAGEEVDQQMITFLSNVPFSKAVLISKVFEIEGKKWVCATNQALCVSVIYGFQEAGLKTTLVLPALVVGVTEKTVFGLDTLAQIESKLASDKPYSMLTNIFEGEKKSWWNFFG